MTGPMPPGPPPPPGPQYVLQYRHDHPQGTTILVLGILSLVGCGLFTGIPAVVMGGKVKKEPGFQSYTNVGQISAGYVCGMIGTVLSAIAILIWLATFIFILATARNYSGT